MQGTLLQLPWAGLLKVSLYANAHHAAVGAATALGQAIPKLAWRHLSVGLADCISVLTDDTTHLWLPHAGAVLLPFFPHALVARQRVFRTGPGRSRVPL